MKKILLSITIVLSLVFVTTAQVAYTYLFSSTPFVSDPPGGPTLAPIGAMTTPVTITIPFTTCPDTPTIDLTHFEFNSGFKAKAFFTGTYSVEMIFKFDMLDGYDRIIDFSNSLSDYGIYTLDDCLNFYPYGDIGICPGAFDTTNYRQLVITRNDTTKNMNVYINDSLFTTYLDATDYYVIGSAPNDTIKFFRDDVYVPNEASTGDVALIRIADYEFSPDEIDSSYSDFCRRITGIKELNAGAELKAFPNPATQNITIELNALRPADYKLTILNSIGTIVWSEKIFVNNTISRTIDLSAYSDGLYILQATSGSELSSYKFIKARSSK